MKHNVCLSIMLLVLFASAAQAFEPNFIDSTLKQPNFYTRPEGKHKTLGLNYFKPVILGVLYRGGSAGTRRANDNDSGVLTRTQLMALCEAGFSKAVYAYGKSKYMIPQVSCVTREGKQNTLSYEGVSYNDKNRFVEIIDDVIRYNKGPVYDHCWNGWHASGELAAVALKQFCDFSDSESQRYWQRNRYDKVAVPSLLKRIANFKPHSNIPALNSATQAELCPSKP